jgi:hypothetical protein
MVRKTLGSMWDINQISEVVLRNNERYPSPRPANFRQLTVNTIPRSRIYSMRKSSGLMRSKQTPESLSAQQCNPMVRRLGCQGSRHIYDQIYTNPRMGLRGLPVLKPISWAFTILGQLHLDFRLEFLLRSQLIIQARQLWTWWLTPRIVPLVMPRALDWRVLLYSLSPPYP